MLKLAKNIFVCERTCPVTAVENCVREIAFAKLKHVQLVYTIK